MRTLLSISALHLAHQRPERSRKEALVAKALLYHRIASREAMELMTGLDARNAENLFLFSLLTIFFGSSNLLRAVYARALFSAGLGAESEAHMCAQPSHPDAT